MEIANAYVTRESVFTWVVAADVLLPPRPPSLRIRICLVCRIPHTDLNHRPAQPAVGLTQSSTKRQEDRPRRQLDNMFFMCFVLCPRALASVATRLQPINGVLNVRMAPLKFMYEARLQEERPFSSGGVTEQTHYPRLPR